MIVTEKKRGILLTSWLIIMLVVKFFAASSFFLANEQIALYSPNITLWLAYLYGIIAFVNLTFVIFLFRWKKWAFYGICINAIIVFIMNLFIGMDAQVAILALSLVVILYLTMRPKWDLFE
ncbi:hypothetical protein KKD70_02245 [Patescibacteria group bacterium]|nr:hypothetical protein [Patescibacteria group bacterium]